MARNIKAIEKAPSELRGEIEETHEKIRKRILKGGDLLNRNIGSAQALKEFVDEYKKWNDFNIALLKRLFTGDEVFEDYQRHTYIAFIGHGGDEETYRFYSKLLEGAIRELESLDERLEVMPAVTSPTASSHAQALPIDSVVRIVNRFSRSVRQLRHRDRDREALVVEDEYDVQYLLAAMLCIEFDDIRPEEPVPSLAGKSSRTDFLLKVESLAIETKMTRDRSSAKKLGEELIQDVVRYKEHPNCAGLVCFVYDPNGFITNPTAVISDIEKQSSPQFPVRVVIQPTP